MSMLLSINFENLHQILRDLYVEMMPLCSNMAGIAKGVAGLGALFYVAYRVWQSLSRAEPIDVFPLLRPFVIGLCIMFFPTIVLGTINNVLSPIVKGTNTMLDTQIFDLNEYQAIKDQKIYESLKNNPKTAYIVDNEAFNEKLQNLGIFGGFEFMGMCKEWAWYHIKRLARDWLRSVLELLFQASALVIDTIRTFFLIVLSILGPIAFAISVWDGFQSTLTQWFTRYISVYLWLPISDLFSSILAKIQILTLQNEIALFDDPSFIPDESNVVYLIFMLIGIVGYFTIPTVANWVIQAGGGMGNYGKNVNQGVTKSGSFAAGATGAAIGNVAGHLKRK